MVTERRVISDSSKQTGARTRGFYNRVYQRSSSRLAVRSGNRHELQGIGRMIKEICRCDRQRLSRVFYLNPRDSARKFLGSWFFTGNGHRAAFYCVFNKRVSVRLGAMQREKERAFLHPAGITSHQLNLDAVGSTRQSGFCPAKQLAQFLSRY